MPPRVPGVGAPIEPMGSRMNRVRAAMGEKQARIHRKGPRIHGMDPPAGDVRAR
jgi:hypothetical protein